MGLDINLFLALFTHLFSGSESDRLGRNAGLVFAPKDSGLDLAHAGMPDANTLAARECLP